jgi:hypothetical protein
MHRFAPAAAAALVAASLLIVSHAAAGQSSSASARAAKLATQKAKSLTYSLLSRGSGVSMGTVTLQRIGSTRTRVRVRLANPAAGAPRVTLRTGADCQEPRIANAARGPIQLNPFTGQTSETVVNVPLTNLQSGNYLLDVQNATARQQAIDACARLSPR